MKPAFMKENISIEYGRYESSGRVILDDLFFYACASEKIGLAADKSTAEEHLIRLLGGELVFTGGNLQINEKKLLPQDAAEALREMVGVISARSRFSHNLSVLENFYIRDRAAFVFRQHSYRRRIHFLLSRFRITFDWNDRISALSAVEKLAAECYCAYLQKKKVLVLVNLTDFLTRRDVEEFMRIVEDLKNEGMTIVMLDRDKRFLKHFAERIFFVRDRRTHASLYTREEKLNRYLEAAYPEPSGGPFADFTAENRSRKVEFRDVCTPVLRDVSFHADGGEITIISCSTEGEYREIWDLLFEGKRPDAGTILLRDSAYHGKNVPDAVRKGLCCVIENATERMLIREESGIENCINDITGKLSRPVCDDVYRRNVLSRMTGYLPQQRLELPVSALSAEEKERLLFGKMLLQAPSAIVCMQPFAYADARISETIREMMLECCRSGIAVIALTLSSADYFQGISEVKVRKYAVRSGMIRK